MTQEQTKTLRVSKLPKHIQETAAKLDTNQDGQLEAQEVIGAISDLQKTQKTNQNLKKTIAVFVVLTAVLVSSVFGASVAAARLAKDVTIDQDTGFALVKGSSTEEVMKTQDALVYRRDVSIGGMSNQELANLKVLSLQDGDLQFDVKGYARNSMEGTVMLLVEGGTLTYNNEGIASSTGDARLLLEATFGPDVHVEGSDGQRRLKKGATTDTKSSPNETESGSEYMKGVCFSVDGYFDCMLDSKVPVSAFSFDKALLEVP